MLRSESDMVGSRESGVDCEAGGIGIDRASARRRPLRKFFTTDIGN